ncbi:MAG: Vitamin B12 transporter BtuB [bacterium]|nr:Vitamin B12 transporter BtuB [bacterium]
MINFLVSSTRSRDSNCFMSKPLFSFICGLLLLMPVVLGAQDKGAVEGVITAVETRAVLPDANILIKGTNIGATTDANGHFKIDNLAAGEYVLEARMVGRQPVRQTVRIEAGKTTAVKFKLATSEILMQNVVVTATQSQQSKADVSATIGGIGRNEIAQTRPTHPSQIMQRVPGVLVTNLSGEGHATAIRQPITTAAVYLYLEDGIPTRSTGFFNHNALYEINVPQAEGIEVLKGPGTALYGSDAIGGVINVTTRPAPARPEFMLSTEGGSFGFGRALLSIGASRGNNAVRVDGNFTRSDGNRDAQGYDRQAGTLRWDMKLRENSRLKTVATFSLIDQKPAGSSALSSADFNSNPELNYTPISFRKVEALRLSSAFEHFTASSHTNLTGYFRYNRMEILPNWTLAFDPAVWDSKNKSFGLVARHRREFAKINSSVVVGVDAESSPGSRLEYAITPTRVGSIYTAYTNGAVQYDYDVTFQEASPYIHAEFLPAKKFRLNGGLRYDFLRYDYSNKLSVVTTGRYRRPESQAVDYSHLSPKAGATYVFNDKLNVFASYRHAFRIPSESQVFRQGQTVNTIGLEPIKANNYEGGVRGGVGNGVEYEVSVYSLIKTDDIVSYVNPDGTRENLNAGKTSHRGVEISLVLQPVSALNLRSSLSFAKHKYEEWKPTPALNFGGYQIESAPRQIINVVATYRPAFWRRSDISLEWTRLGSYYLDADNLHRYGGHDLVNLRASAQLLSNLGLFARVNNLTDELYAESAAYTAARGEEFSPGLPRSIYIGFQFDWQARPAP